MIVHEIQVSYNVIAVSGPRQPKNDIDIYLADIIEDLNIVWKEKVEVFDAYLHELFTL